MLALQILLAHADLALRTHDETGKIAISPRKVLIEIRGEICYGARRTRPYAQRLKNCRAENRRQSSPKAIREWHRRKPHKPPSPPIFLTLEDERKAILQHYLQAA